LPLFAEGIKNKNGKRNTPPLLSIIPLELLGILVAERRGMDPGGDIAKITTEE